MRNKFFYLGLSIFFLLLIILFFNLSAAFFKTPESIEEEKKPAPSLSTPRVYFYKGGVEIASFDVEIASTAAQHRKGLMYRKNLPKNQGMLFIFEKERPLSFWMKNTLIPLDIIFISKDKKVVSIAFNALPCQKDPCPSYYSYKPAQYVVEINGGLAEKFGIKKGAEVKFNLP